MTVKQHARRAEVLAPAGSLRKLKTAILYGADAVYAGTPDMSLRTKSSFSLEDLLEGVNFAHAKGKKIYLTLNLFSHNKDVEKLPMFIDTVRTVKPDGLIIADPGVFDYVKEHAPELELHVSTQANICSWLTVDFWQRQGASLAVLAREISFNELAEIRRRCPNIKLETFVQGSMCMTYSGRCLLSNFMSERGANQGNCSHSCRWKYKVKLRLKDGRNSEFILTDQNRDLFDFLLEEEFRPGQFFPIEEDDMGSYILNSKDLCLMTALPEYLKIGVDSLKIEGRNKGEYYAAITARAYRLAVDAWYSDPENWRADSYLKELYTLQNRGYTMGFHSGRLRSLAHNYDHTAPIGGYRFGGVVREWDGDHMIFEVRNFFVAGDVIEFVPPHAVDPVRLRVYAYEDAHSGTISNKVSAGQGRCIRIPANAFTHEDTKTIKSLLPALTVARQEMPLSEHFKYELMEDIRSQEVERELITLEQYREYIAGMCYKKLSIKDRAITGKSPKLGWDGCCGRGCNGCLKFWYDAKYAKAREKITVKKQGELLSTQEKTQAIS